MSSLCGVVREIKLDLTRKTGPNFAHKERKKQTWQTITSFLLLKKHQGAVKFSFVKITGSLATEK